MNGGYPSTALSGPSKSGSSPRAGRPGSRTSERARRGSGRRLPSRLSRRSGSGCGARGSWCGACGGVGTSTGLASSRPRRSRSVQPQRCWLLYKAAPVCGLYRVATTLPRSSWAFQPLSLFPVNAEHCSVLAVSTVLCRTRTPTLCAARQAAAERAEQRQHGAGRGDRRRRPGAGHRRTPGGGPSDGSSGGSVVDGGGDNGEAPQFDGDGGDGMRAWNWSHWSKTVSVDTAWMMAAEVRWPQGSDTGF